MVAVQEMIIKTIPKKNKGKKAKSFSEEDLQIAEKRRAVKGKGERERYIQLNTEFQRIARRKPSSVINAKKQRKIIEWDRLEISRKLGYEGEISHKDGHNKGQKRQGPKRRD